MSETPRMDEYLQALMAESVRPLTALARSVTPPWGPLVAASVDTALARATEVASMVSQRSLHRGESLPLLPAVEDLHAALRVPLPDVSSRLGSDLAADLLRILRDAEELTGQLPQEPAWDGLLLGPPLRGVGDGSDEEEEKEPEDEESDRDLAQMRERIRATLAQLVTLEARVRARATEVNDGLDAYLGLITKAMMALTFAHVWLDKLIK